MSQNGFDPWYGCGFTFKRDDSDIQELKTAMYNNYSLDDVNNSNYEDYELFSEKTCKMQQSEGRCSQIAYMKGEEKSKKSKSLLKSVEEIPEKFRIIFKDFPYFNIVQSTVFEDVVNSDKSVVVAAPTGSGKTVIMALAIVRLLVQEEENVSDFNSELENLKIIYMAPLKAIVSERFLDWKNRFENFGLVCAEITGDSTFEDFLMFKKSQIILTTPEKWDFMTRRWKEHTALMQNIRLLLLDEVHILNEEMRGPTLEAVVSRMKTIQSIYKRDTTTLRVIAVSATIPNVDDVANWLKIGKEPATFHKLEERLRPVQLRRVVLGYPSEDSWSDYRFDLSLNYKIASVIHTYSDNKPTLVFASTRKGAQQTAFIIRREARLVRDSSHKEKLNTIANCLKDNKLRECVMFGVGFHHAGVDATDRRQIETLFIEGDLPVLVSTSTLAMGVNLPAHLVIIKSTSYYVNGEYKEYPVAQIFQMIGRAGRPQFDKSATAVIMTRCRLKAKYESLLTGKDVLESHLHKHLVEHLNAEIVLGTIDDLSVAVEWLRSTFFYVRVQKNPQFYKFPKNISAKQLENKLQELCTKEVNALSSIQLISMTDLEIRSTHAGKLMATYCVSFQTMKSFINMTGNESLKELLDVISKCKEFEDIKLRSTEKKTLNDINKNVLRFPFKGRIKTTPQKVSCLVQSAFRCHTMPDYGLSQETSKILRIGKRLTKCLFEYSFSRKEYELVVNATILHKIFICQLWESSHMVSRQLDRIGPALATSLANAKFNSFTSIESADPRELELICNRQPPFGSRLKEQAQKLPQYELQVQQIGDINEEKSSFIVTVSLVNMNMMNRGRPTTDLHHSSLLILGDRSNRIIYSQRITDKSLLSSDGKVSKEFKILKSPDGDEIFINFISETWAGLDVQSVYIPRYTPTLSLSQFQSTDGDFLSKKIEMPKKGKENSHKILKAPKRKNAPSLQSKMGPKKACNRGSSEGISEKRPTTLFQYRFVKTKPKMNLYQRDEESIYNPIEKVQNCEMNNNDCLADEKRDEVIDVESVESNADRTNLDLDSDSIANRRSESLCRDNISQDLYAGSKQSQCQETSHRATNLLAESLRKENTNNQLKGFVNRPQTNAHNTLGRKQNYSQVKTPNRTLNYWFPHRKPIAGIRPMILKKQNSEVDNRLRNSQRLDTNTEIRESYLTKRSQSLLTLYQFASNGNSSQLSQGDISQNIPAVARHSLLPQGALNQSLSMVSSCSFINSDSQDTQILSRRSFPILHPQNSTENWRMNENLNCDGEKEERFTNTLGTDSLLTKPLNTQEEECCDDASFDIFKGIL